ncbi:hypothetical protein DACRYDRAFT_53933, partial [Dacryopinax primogenitus]
ESGKEFECLVLVNSGGTGLLIDPSYMCMLKLKTTKLAYVILAFNINGLLNQVECIMHTVNLVVCCGAHTEHATFHVCSIGYCEVILGFLWLAKHNLEINWQAKTQAMAQPRQVREW